MTSAPRGRCRSEAGATYVFDLGYYDFGFFSELDVLGCRLVTCFKANTPLNEPREMPLERGSTVLSDRIGFLPARQAMTGRTRCRTWVARDRGQDRDRRDAAPSGQRSRRACAGDRGSLQASLADRVVLPADEADAQDHEVRRKIGKRRAHPDRRCLWSPFFFCAARRSSRKKPTGSSNSFDWCARTSCTEKTRHDSENRSPHRHSTPANSNSA